MNREQVISRVAAVIPAVLTDAGISASDSPGHMREPIEAALEALGLPVETDEVTDPIGFIALVKYHTLLAAEGRMADRFDLTVPAGAFRLGQALGNVQKMIERSEKELTALFGTPHSRSSAQIITLGIFG